MPIAMGGRGFNLVTGTIEHIDLIDAPSSVNLNSNSGANQIQADVIRGLGGIGLRLMGGTYKAGLGFQPENQTNHSGIIFPFGDFGREDLSVGDRRIKTNPDGNMTDEGGNILYLTGPVNPVPHGNHNKYDTVGGAIAETLPSAFGHEGQIVRISNRNGGEGTPNVTVALFDPLQTLEGNISGTPGPAGTDTVFPGTSRTYEVVSAGYNGALPGWQLVSIA
jgi:hypothetical protein